MLRERLPCRPFALEARDRRRACRRGFRRQLVLGRRGLKLFELQLHLVDEPRGPLGLRSEPLPLQLLDGELQLGDQRPIVGSRRPLGGRLGLSGEHQRLQRFNVVRQGFARRLHARIES